MPGRPKTMHKKIAALEEQAEALESEVWSLMPAMYREQRAGGDDLQLLWDRAGDAASALYLALGDLSGRLYAKAYRKEVALFERQQLQSCVPLSEEEKEGMVRTIVGQFHPQTDVPGA